MRMKGYERLSQSIVLTISALFALQSLIIALIRTVNPELPAGMLFFYPAALLYHAGITLGLFAMRSYFRFFPDGRKMTRINLANRLTLFRLSSLPTLLSLTLLSRYSSIHLPLILLTVTAFVTDFADGRIARLGHQTTEIGKILDSFSDYMVLLALSIVLVFFHLLPLWLFLLNLLRGLVMGTGMIVLSVKRKRVRGITTFLGKLWVASMMVLYGLELLRLLPHPVWYTDNLLPFIEAMAGIIILASLYDKLVFLRDHFKAQKNSPGKSEG